LGQRVGDDREVRVPVRSVITVVNARGLARLRIDVLVRADGGSGALDLPGFPPGARARQGRPVLLVDFGDDGDAIAATATRRRLEDYQARGWDVSAPDRWFCDPEPAPDRRRSRSRRGSERRENVI
jgi:hypothetical protein